ncbi:hypothetical protein IQ243_28700 [Nostocales cyanobacterium LEGE 11386]|nr:hypothetical protein [Nostocales cyanobacterium LEGE 11386]
MEKISIKECRSLLKIQSKDTINKYLKALDFFGNKYLSWEQVQKILELQIFLGLKHGRNSKEDFCQMTRRELEQTFQSYGVDVNARLTALKKIHRDSVQQKLTCVSTP